MNKIAVIGAGTMGSGIAQVAATAGCLVKLFDTFPDALSRSKNNLDKSFFANYNERMDDFFLYFESNKANCLKRLDYKQLKKNPCPPSTHECDLSADKGAWRIFGHEEGNTFVIDTIGPGLH